MSRKRYTKCPHCTGGVVSRKRHTHYYNSWRDYAAFVGVVSGNNDNLHQDDSNHALLYVHNADMKVYMYELTYEVSKLSIRHNMEVAHDCKITGRWQHYYATRKEI